MGLFNKLLKSNAKVKTNNFGQRLDRLTPEGELPWGWIYENRDFVKDVEQEYKIFFDSWISAKRESVKVRYAALKSLVLYTEDIKSLCAKKGECFARWASINVADDSMLEELKNELKYIEDHRAELEEKYEMEQRIQKQLPGIVRDNPGILQTEVYKMFPTDYKSYVSSELHRMEREGKIIREKNGRTYSLKLK